MVRIYISYNHGDADVARQIADRLKQAGHDLTLDVESLSPGQEWRGALSEGLKNSEVFLAILTEKSLKSQFVISEIGAARAFSQTSRRMLMIPILLDDIPIPPIISDVQVISSPNRDIPSVCAQIEEAISAWLGRQAAEEERRDQVQKRIEANAAEFIDDAISSLARIERRNRIVGNSWYAVGFGALIGGVGFSLFTIARASAASSLEWVTFAVLALKSLIVIALLGACARYGFSLGKSFIAEALKCSDRLHAIAFGKFYLSVYGTDVEWSELKEAFQHWNIDRASAFSTLTVQDVDPKIIESLVEAAKIVAGVKKGAA